MRKCGSCGTINREGSGACSGCGLLLNSGDKSTLGALTTALLKNLGTLNAWSASITLGIYFAITTLWVTGFHLIVIPLFTLRTISPAEALPPSDWPRLIVLSCAPILGLSGVLVTSSVLYSASFKSLEPEGGAWAIGGLRSGLHGLSIGVLIGLINWFICPAPGTPVSSWNPDNPQFSAYLRADQLLWAAAVIFLTPLAEETLFRGVLYGGFRKTFGADLSAILTTIIFIALHRSQILETPAFLVSCTSLSAAAIWFRLTYGAIGAAVAVHSGFNLVAFIRSMSFG